MEALEMSWKLLSNEGFESDVIRDKLAAEGVDMESQLDDMIESVKSSTEKSIKSVLSLVKSIEKYLSGEAKTQSEFYASNKHSISSALQDPDNADKEIVTYSVPRVSAIKGFKFLFKKQMTVTSRLKQASSSEKLNPNKSGEVEDPQSTYNGLLTSYFGKPYTEKNQVKVKIVETFKEKSFEIVSDSGAKILDNYVNALSRTAREIDILVGETKKEASKVKNDKSFGKFIKTSKNRETFIRWFVSVSSSLYKLFQQERSVHYRALQMIIKK